MEQKQKALASIFLVVMLLSMLGNASAMYYYTDEYFKEKFGTGYKVAEKFGDKTATQIGMVFFDSKAYQESYGLKPASKPVAEPLAGGPGSGPAEGAPPDEVEIVVVPVQINNTGSQGPAAGEPSGAANLTPPGEANATPPAEDDAPPDGAPAIIAVPQGNPAANGPGGDEPPRLVVTGGATGAVVVAGEEPAADGGQPAAGAAADGTGAPQGTPYVVNGTAPAAVAAKGGMPIQLVVIGLLVVVIVAMLAVLLTRKEGGEGASKGKAKGDWEEGEFFKEVDEKKDARKNGKKDDKLEKEDKDANSKKAVKAEEKKADKKEAKEEAPKKEAKLKTNGEVKPFLLKIKEEAE